MGIIITSPSTPIPLFSSRSSLPSLSSPRGFTLPWPVPLQNSSSVSSELSNVIRVYITPTNKMKIGITGILNIVIGIGTAVYYFLRHYYSAAIVFAIFSIFTIICFVSWIPRIPFSVLMLQTTMDVAKGYGHVFTVSALGGLAALAFGAWFSVTLVSIYVKYQPNNHGSNPACSHGGCSSAKVIGLIVFITFAGYWITEFIKNVIHTTIAGIYGTWFFCSGKPGGMPKGATRGAFRRAMTYSFGSISFGSLVVALINMLRQGVSIAQQQEAQQGNIIGSIAFCCLGCIIGLLDWAVQFM